MKRFLIVLFLISFLISSDVDVGRYQLTVSSITSSRGKVYVVETVLDTKTFKIVGRNKILLSRYKKVEKND